MKLIHISDIHIHPELIRDEDPVKNFELCMTHVEKNHADADMVVITGDLTHRGLIGSYEKLKELLRNWRFDPHLIIGNHDHRETFQNFFPETRKDKNGYVQYTVSRPEGRFIFLDTVQAGTDAGYFCSDRQAWFRKQLAEAVSEHRPIYLFMHHNPVAVGITGSDAIGLTDGEAFRAILSEFRSQIRHLFFGHCHYILSGSVCGIPMSAPRSTNHACIPDFSGSSKIRFGSLPPTYNVCLLEDDSMIVHSIDFRDGDAPA